ELSRGGSGHDRGIQRDGQCAQSVHGSGTLDSRARRFRSSCNRSCATAHYTLTTTHGLPMRFLRILIPATATFLLAAAAGLPARPESARPPRSLPVLPAAFEPSFEPNGGQDPAVLFLSRGNGYMLRLGATGAVLDLAGTSARVMMSFAGGAKPVEPE